MLGEKPATYMEPNWEEGDWGREEGEGEQERVWLSKGIFLDEKRRRPGKPDFSLSRHCRKHLWGGCRTCFELL